MKSILTLKDIVNYGTIGGPHLAGEARFSDGRRYRFVIISEMDYNVRPHTRKAPAVTSMAIPHDPPKIDPRGYEMFQDHRSPFPVRAALIMAAYPEYLARAKVEKAERDAANEVKRKAENLAYAQDKALKEAAPDLLAALTDVLDSLGALSNPSELENRMGVESATRVFAAITKATTIPTL